MFTAETILNFYDELDCPALPPDIEPLLPFKNENTKMVMNLFYRKYYNDKNQRIVLFGINPGRFGAGLTGINFTDPIRLKEKCGIQNDFNPRPELSSIFIYEMIEQWGGEDIFFENFWFSAISPIGFTENGKNINYYDRTDLLNATKDFIVKCLNQHCKMNINRRIAFTIGQGKNLEFLQKLNDTHHFFEKIEPLPHPRWIMQYRLKDKQYYINAYIKALNEWITH